MTVLPRGARNRRSGRRPGWQMLTALLVLAILASSTLVFTSRVELLRLAVILSLWAAVLAAFVSVIYRRQSEADQARARDMKFVYDLQLEREISARREYELAVEAHLRRQVTREVGAAAADEMAALRAELVSLRANLEALLGTGLDDRRALESDRIAEPVSMPMPPPPGRVESSRIPPTLPAEHVEADSEAAESPIIDVPEEPLTPPQQPVPTASSPPPPVAAPPRPAPAPPPSAPPQPAYVPPAPAPPRPAPVPAPPQPAHRAPEQRPAQPGSHRRPEQPAPASPQMPWRPPETTARRGRHWSPGETPAPPPAPGPAAAAAPADPGRGRHRVEPTEATPTAPAARHRSAEEAEADQGQHTGGQSVADLMARLEAGGRTGRGGRRRRED